MRILYAGMINLAEEAGPSLHFSRLAQALQSRGHEVAVIARGDRVLASFSDLDVHLVGRIKVPQVATLVNDVVMFLVLARRLRSGQYDVLYQRGVPFANGWARRLKIPSLVEVNGVYVDELSLRGVGGFKLRAYQFRERQIVENAAKVICVTKGIQRQLVERYSVTHDQCLVLPNAADTSLFRPQPQLECQRRVGLCSDWYNIGFIGSFGYWVDFDSLLQATRILLDQHVPVHCTLVGDGPMRTTVEQQIDHLELHEAVDLVGRALHQDVPDWIGAFDVCIAPFLRARNETIGLSPLKLFEYMACQRPVVATALPGIIEAVESAQAGLLYPLEDQEKLAQHLYLLYENAELRQAFENHGREYVLKHHSWQGVAERIEAVMLDLLGK
jgi:glycosyltransferase involved in cell wall biosynthesis